MRATAFFRSAEVGAPRQKGAFFLLQKFCVGILVSSWLFSLLIEWLSDRNLLCTVAQLLASALSPGHVASGQRWNEKSGYRIPAGEFTPIHLTTFLRQNIKFLLF